MRAAIREHLIEALVGLLVVLVAVWFIYMAWERTGGGREAGAIHVKALFPNVSGIDNGADVRVAGMKIGFGLALKVSVVAEIFGVTSGIGYIMNYSREILATQMVFVWAIVMILVMLAIDSLIFDPIARRLARWR